MKIHRLDHIGITVNELPAVKKFFLDFGLEILGEGKVEGDWVNRMERIIGLRDVKEEDGMLRTLDGDANIELVVLRAPGGSTNIELVKFHTSSNENSMQHPLANILCTRHIAFAVENIEALVTKMTKNGAELLGEIQNYANVQKLCFIRGPEGIILELAEEIK